MRLLKDSEQVRPPLHEEKFDPREKIRNLAMRVEDRAMEHAGITTYDIQGRFYVEDIQGGKNSKLSISVRREFSAVHITVLNHLSEEGEYPAREEEYIMNYAGHLTVYHNKQESPEDIMRRTLVSRYDSVRRTFERDSAEHLMQLDAIVEPFLNE